MYSKAATFNKILFLLLAIAALWAINEMFGITPIELVIGVIGFIRRLSI